MRLAKTFIPVASGSPAATARELLALIATPEPLDADAADAAPGRFDQVLVYLHGFPDLAVHPAPARVAFASRVPRKLAESWLLGPQRNAAFVTFNFGGVPGSDTGDVRFEDKTVGQEVADAVAVCRFVRATLLRAADAAAAAADGARPRIHVVGLSTGAIVAALLRSERGLCDSLAVIAGLLDVPRGVPVDFSPRQLAQVEARGYCWKEFYLPEGSELPRRAELSLDGETRASQDELAALAAAPSKLYMRVNRRYVDECLDGSLDVRAAVDGSRSSSSSSSSSGQDSPLPPLLVIHGDADQRVPIAWGEALFAAAAEPKTFVAIPKANHLLSNSKHLKLALRAIRAHVDG